MVDGRVVAPGGRIVASSTSGTEGATARREHLVPTPAVQVESRVWYNEENSWVVGVLDPKTNTFTEYPVVPADPDEGIAGARDIFVDKYDNVWLPLRKGTGTMLHRFEPSTKTFASAP